MPASSSSLLRLPSPLLSILVSNSSALPSDWPVFSPMRPSSVCISVLSTLPLPSLSTLANMRSFIAAARPAPGSGQALLAPPTELIELILLSFRGLEVQPSTSGDAAWPGHSWKRASRRRIGPVPALTQTGPRSQQLAGVPRPVREAGPFSGCLPARHARWTGPPPSPCVQRRSGFRGPIPPVPTCAPRSPAVPAHRRRGPRPTSCAHRCGAGELGDDLRGRRLCERVGRWAPLAAGARVCGVAGAVHKGQTDCCRAHEEAAPGQAWWRWDAVHVGTFLSRCPPRHHAVHGGLAAQAASLRVACIPLAAPSCRRGHKPPGLSPAAALVCLQRRRRRHQNRTAGAYRGM